jgi:hypothetical protein
VRLSTVEASPVKRENPHNQRTFCDLLNIKKAKKARYSARTSTATSVGLGHWDVVEEVVFRKLWAKAQVNTLGENYWGPRYDPEEFTSLRENPFLALARTPTTVSEKNA